MTRLEFYRTLPTNDRIKMLWASRKLWWYWLTRHSHTENCRDSLPMEQKIAFPIEGTKDIETLKEDLP
jgi:hypothetical protein